jgi:hypothetical protein
MVALNFKAQFAEAVCKGTKRQTIRANRRRPFEVGDTLQFYTGMRTKNCQRIRQDEKCTFVGRITIDKNRQVWLGLNRLWGYDLLELAKDDGFSTPDEMIDFFEATHGLPFEGQLIRW